MSTALYRRYRPETFADVIGQEHVTEPLITALAHDRVNHAYLFSGPRGCGKTTSARILARCLNCAQGPTPTPCGECDSCRELSRDGGGSLDVIEMDAASHGGVDHARDLRERATFAPVRDRFKIFIIDEAHMVTREGFNALLKIVEEPPEHIKFIFATTEPNKVLGTIRSRTHHYPFRLVPPETLQNYLQGLCDEENVQVEPGVLPLVVRAGGGSVRDSLSILDQLMAGSGESGITYDLAVALLGFTHGELLDEVVAAFAGGDSAEVFASVDRVIQTGQDPRRFVEDLLERFRDLIIVRAVPDSAQSILRGMSTDQLDRLKHQAAGFGGAELSRAADVTNEALNEMSGATSPQLHLELLCARILLPAADKSSAGLGTRMDRLERRLASGEVVAPAGDSSGRRRGAGQPAPAASAPEQAVSESPASQPGSGENQPRQPEKLQSAPLAGLRRPASEPVAPAPEQAPTQAAPQQNQAPQQQPAHGQNTVMMVANSWQEILGHVQSPTARNWFGNCEPSKFENGALYIRADINTLRRVKEYIPQLKTALFEVLQLRVDIHAEVAKQPQSPKGAGQAAPASTGQDAGGSQGNSQNPASPPLAQQNYATHQSQAHNQGMPENRADQQNQAVQQAPIAEGPRGGEDAWRTHGQPRTTEAPQWSTEDWDNPVTSWDVASIPTEQESSKNENSEQVQPEAEPEQGSTQPAESQSAPEERAVQNNEAPAWGAQNSAMQNFVAQNQGAQNWESQQNQDSQSADSAWGASTGRFDNEPVDDWANEPDEEPSPETGPQLRVIQGEAPEHKDPLEQARENHPSSGRWRKPDISAAADPEQAEPAEQGQHPSQPQQESPTKESPASRDPQKLTGRDRFEHIRAQQRAARENGEAVPGAPAQEPSESLKYWASNSDWGGGNGYSDRKVDPSHTFTDSPAPETADSHAPSFRERYAEQLQAGQRASEQEAASRNRSQGESSEPENFTVSDEDEALESSMLVGQRAVEKILGGVVIEEIPHSQ